MKFKMSRTVRRLAGLLWLSLGAGGALAQAPAPSPTPFTLVQAFEAAWARQPEALAGTSLREAAQQQRRAAERWTPEPPSLELNLRSDRPLGRQQGQREQEIGIAVPLWLPGERERSQDLAAAEQASVDSRSAAVAWRLAGQLREAWWVLQRARQSEALADVREQGAAALARDVQRRVAAGDLARSDGHQAEGQLAAARAEAALARAEAVQALQALRALGLPESADQALDAAEPLPAEEPPGSHPALRELEDRWALARRAQALAAVQGRANPELSLAATRERGAFGEDYGRSLNLGLRIPFGSNAAVQRARLAGAEAAATEVEAQLLLERQRLAAEQAAARARLVATEQALIAAERRAALAAEARGFIEKSFRLGESDLPARLRVEQEAIEAQRQQALARLARHQAISTLRQALGLLPQ